MHAVQATSSAVVSQAMTLNHGVLVKSQPAMSSDLAIKTSQMVSGPPASLSQVPASQASVLSAPMCTLVTKVSPAVGQASKMTIGPKVTTTQQAVPPKASQTTIQLPANFQIPPGKYCLINNFVFLWAPLLYLWSMDSSMSCIAGYKVVGKICCYGDRHMMHYSSVLVNSTEHQYLFTPAATLQQNHWSAV